MKTQHLCKVCIKAKTGKSARDLPVQLFNQLRNEMAFTGDKCPTCGSDDLIKLFGIETSYIKGYGFADKKGTKRDMDLHTMINGRDPYPENRQMGEVRGIIGSLQKDREHKKRPKSIHINR